MRSPKKPADGFDVCSTPPNATVRIGPYRFYVDRQQFDAWSNRLTAETGFHNDDINAELKRRLGLD